MRSMTGFGAGQAERGAHGFRVEIRTVNHRFFEARVKTEGTCPTVPEEYFRERLKRGRADVLVRREGLRTAFDPEVLRQAVAEVARLRDAIAPGEALPWTLVGELVRGHATSGAVDPECEAALDDALRAAMRGVEATRLREGAKLEEELARLLGDLESQVSAIDQALPRLLERHRDRVTRRFRELAEGLASKLPSERIELEIALLAERMDVREEVARLRAHDAAFRSHLTSEEPIGRTLDFLVQEMLREVNTLGSKVADAEIAHRVVAAKATIERLREQVQNVL